MSPAAGQVAAPPRADPAWPRLRPLAFEELREDLGDPPPLAELPAPAGWTALVSALRADAAQAPVLMQALTWGLGDEDLLWWALLCARFEEAVAKRAQPSRALVSAERWLRERDETVRHETFALAQAEAKPGPGALAGYAAFLAGPSLSPPDAKPQPPPAGAARGAAMGALSTAAVAPAMTATGRAFDVVNLIGLEIAAGRDGRAAARRALSAVEQGRAEASA